MLKNYLSKKYLVKDNTIYVVHDVLQMLNCQNLKLCLQSTQENDYWKEGVVFKNSSVVLFLLNMAYVIMEYFFLDNKSSCVKF